MATERGGRVEECLQVKQSAQLISWGRSSVAGLSNFRNINRKLASPSLLLLCCWILLGIESTYKQRDNNLSVNIWTQNGCIAWLTLVELRIELIGHSSEQSHSKALLLMDQQFKQFPETNSLCKALKWRYFQKMQLIVVSETQEQVAVEWEWITSRIQSGCYPPDRRRSIEDYRRSLSHCPSNWTGSISYQVVWGCQSVLLGSIYRSNWMLVILWWRLGEEWTID